MVCAKCSPAIELDFATPDERRPIFRVRHDVYARELRQHPPRAEELLSDPLDAFNVYLVARREGMLIGFISITPPGDRYSIDNYLPRDELPFTVNDRLYEVRLLTILESARGGAPAWLLMYAALRYIETQDGTRVVAIGRDAVVPLYEKCGLRSLGRSVRGGDVTFEVMSATVDALRVNVDTHGRTLMRRTTGRIRWQFAFPFLPPAKCFHGGAFFDAIGDSFASINRRREVINADVLDAWFAPSPKVLSALQDNLDWLVRTSPPSGCEGLLRTMAEVRGVASTSLVPGGGSSDLVFRAMCHWLNPTSRVVLPDPTYGEYAHVLEKVIGCRVDHLTLSADNDYALEERLIEAVVDDPPDLLVLVNPNSPTGQHAKRATLEELLRRLPISTRVWIDETYIDYVGQHESLESFAAASENVVVCKSMSKVYALSGMRAAYLCGPRKLIDELRAITPPWVIGLAAQVAAVNALGDPEYYATRYRETHELRHEMLRAVVDLGINVVPGVANFLLTHFPEDAPTAADVVQRCKTENVFLRDASTMGRALGPRALRIAVKSHNENRRIIDAISRGMR